MREVGVASVVRLFWAIQYLMTRRGCVTNTRRASGKGQNGTLLPACPLKARMCKSSQNSTYSFAFLVYTESSTKSSFVSPEQTINAVFLLRSPHKAVKTSAQPSVTIGGCTMTTSRGAQRSAQWSMLFSEGDKRCHSLSATPTFLFSSIKSTLQVRWRRFNER